MPFKIATYIEGDHEYSEGEGGSRPVSPHVEPSTPPTSPQGNTGDRFSMDRGLSRGVREAEEAEDSTASPFWPISVAGSADTTSVANPKRKIAFRRRAFCVTYWGDTVNTARFDEPENNQRIVYVVYQRELCPRTQRLHWQMFIEFASPEPVQYVKYLLDDNTAHIEMIKTSRDQARLYCMKTATRVDPEGRPTEWGTWRIQGERTDLKAVQNDIEANHSMAEIGGTHFNLMMRHPQGIKMYKALQLQSKGQSTNRQVNVRVHVGKTGTGKSFSAMKEAMAMSDVGMEDVYILDKGGEGALWFDGYEGQTCLIIDDYDGWIAISFLLRMLDRYPCRLPVKGSFSYANWTNVWITSNKRPDEWKASHKGEKMDPRHVEALLRRVSYLAVFNSDFSRTVKKDNPVVHVEL